MKSYMSIACQERGDIVCWKSDTGSNQLWVIHDTYCENVECPGCAAQNGVNWIVLDQYCVVPDCTCKTAHLSFYRVASGKVQPSPEVSAEVDLDSGSVSESFPPPLNEEQLRAVAGFEEALPASKRELSLRRKLTREIAAKRLSIPADPDGKAVPAVSPKKPSRNDPCPRGSGKKFKKCCGRA